MSEAWKEKLEPLRPLLRDLIRQGYIVLLERKRLRLPARNLPPLEGPLEVWNGGVLRIDEDADTDVLEAALREVLAGAREEGTRG